MTGEEGREYLKGKYIIIATGARPVIPDIPGIDLQGVSNSDRILAAQNWNYDRVVIMGGGVIGVEFATIFQALCSSVTLVEKGSHLLGPMDTEVALALQNQLEEKGITVLCNSVIEKIEEMGDEDGLACQVTNEKTKETSRIRATQVIVAIGRRPYMDRLLGEDVSLDMEDGRLVVDGDFMTSEKNIYAIGDVVSKTQLAHVSMAQGTYVVEELAGKPHSIQLEAVPNGMYVSLPIVPSCIYTVPEIATVGITEQAATALGMKVRCGIYNMNDNGKSIITHKGDGLFQYHCGSTDCLSASYGYDWRDGYSYCQWADCKAAVSGYACSSYIQ